MKSDRIQAIREMHESCPCHDLPKGSRHTCATETLLAEIERARAECIDRLWSGFVLALAEMAEDLKGAHSA